MRQVVRTGERSSGWRALEQAYGAIRARGSTAHLGADPMTFDEFNETIGLERRYADDERYRSRR